MLVMILKYLYFSLIFEAMSKGLELIEIYEDWVTSVFRSLVILSYFYYYQITLTLSLKNCLIIYGITLIALFRTLSYKFLSNTIKVKHWIAKKPSFFNSIGPTLLIFIVFFKEFRILDPLMISLCVIIVGVNYYLFLGDLKFQIDPLTKKGLGLYVLDLFTELLNFYGTDCAIFLLLWSELCEVSFNCIYYNFKATNSITQSKKFVFVVYFIFYVICLRLEQFKYLNVNTLLCYYMGELIFLWAIKTLNLDQST